jgi:hypothetical protein
MIGIMTLEKALEILGTDKKFRNSQTRKFKRILSLDESVTLERIFKIIDLFGNAGFRISFNYSAKRKWCYAVVQTGHVLCQTWYIGLASVTELLETPRSYLLQLEKEKELRE